ncbi:MULTISPECIES: ABC transporter permease [Priestia]|jgi:teichoic acid transport system permease protein|uniref:ABC transporter permease n=1 Tax=Priestia TaxID=2800373 RepID=UPI000470403F|nr:MULTISPECIES: ABC transporter permease [Priestia]TCN14043.1 teichoic acid transport system permease protein [Bacillus sp. BK006]MBU8752342.1 ABC transporter permease [Priestia megaterium]MED3883957.1 ABC transporter permease [Priestia aryabhattai]MED4261188.1 ABC transporter permease [Priestia aryabhattai]PFA99174.1 teichoic acid ABC transporter permease [Priestia megaterium]
MKSMKIVLQEQLENLYMIGRLSAYELKKSYADNVLGSFWLLLNPLFQIGVYWIVFGLGVRGGRDVGDTPFVIWLICGLVPWFFISSSILQGSNSVYARLNSVSKMNFPLSVIPTYVIVAQAYTHLILVGILLLIVISSQGLSHLNVISLLYFMISSFCFLLSLSFITSTLSTMVRDIHLLIQTATRMLFYVTPILWLPSENAPQLLQDIFKLNPFYYVVEGYRDSLLTGGWGLIASPYTLVFWLIIVVMLFFGSAIHVKFRKQFVDYL